MYRIREFSVPVLLVLCSSVALAGTVTDIDGNVYQTVTIGTQVWMAENLKVTHYRNGDAIPNVASEVAWSRLATGAYCNYNNDVNNVATYGRLYNWHAAVDSRNIAPIGWHVASDAEWQTLVDYLGGETVAGGKMKEVGTTHWHSPNTGATNEGGLSVLPGGYRDMGGMYFIMSSYAIYWSSTEYLSDYAWSRHLDCDSSGINRYDNLRENGFSVRCVKDAESSTVTHEVGTLTDIDGNIYKTIRIGDQWWMAENLKVTHYRNGDVIPNVTDSGAWAVLTVGAYCEYNNDANTVATYGRLYNWHAVDDARNIAPVGWHVPTDAEWKQLEMTLGMRRAQADSTYWRGTTEGGKLKEAGSTYWASPNTGATNESGFSALPGGYRFNKGRYANLRLNAYFWSSTDDHGFGAWGRFLHCDASGVNRFGNDYDGEGYSIRCVKD